MKMRSPVDLDVANFEKAAPSLQAVQRQTMRFGMSLRARPGPSHRLDVHRPVSLDGLGPHVGRQANMPFTSVFALFLAQQFGLRLPGFFVHQSLPPAQESRLSEPMLRATATLRQAAAPPCLHVNRPPFTSTFVLEVFRSYRRFSNAAENPKWYESALLKICAETDGYAPTMDGKIKAPPSAGRMWLVGLEIFDIQPIRPAGASPETSTISMRQTPSL